MIEYFSQFLFAIPIQFSITLVFVILCCVHFRKLQELKILLLYSIASLSQCVFGIYISVYSFHSEEEISWVHNSINVFMLLESIIFSVFISKSLTARSTKLLVAGILFCFVIFVFYDWITTDSFYRLPSFLTLLECYCMILGCFIYYLELLYFPAKISFLKDYRFWIITGIFLLFSFLIPIFLQRRTVYHGRIEMYNTIYLITFLGYITLFTCFIIGVRWKIKN